MKNKEVPSSKKKSNFGFKAGFILVFILAAVVLVVVNFSDIFVNLLFFKEVAQTDVYLKQVLTMIKLFVPFFIAYLLIYSSYLKALQLKIRRENDVRKVMSSFTQKNFNWLVGIAVSLPLSYYSASSIWMKLLEYMGKTPFGYTDPVFAKDVSFYVFDLPLLKQVVILLFVNAVILFLFTLLASFFTYGKDFKNADKYMGKEKFETENNRFAKRFTQGTGNFFSKLMPMFEGAFRRSFMFIFALFFFVGALWVYISKFSLLYGSHGLGYGAYFTDVNIKIPALSIISALLLLGGVNFFLNMFGKVKLVRYSVSLCVIGYVGMLAVGYVYQTYIVSPNEYSKEKTYIEYNIQATREAYGLDNIEVKDFAANTNLTADDIYNNLNTIENIPINDYKPTLSTYNSIQGIRPYYQFYDVDTDRYTINGRYTQMFLSARELSSAKLEDTAQNWINTHLKYTHGFGVAASKVNEVNETGQPVLSLKDIPTYATVSGMNIEEPRVYFGEMTDEYAIVATKSKEFDYPEGSANKENSYTGTGGIQLSTANKVLFAINTGNLKFLLSSDIDASSKILINRNITKRVEKIAPFLKYDNDPYLVISEGKLYYIIDGMTTSSSYPYSQRYSKDEDFNYIRNSVKVVIDAYNGTVTYYKMTDNDPILNAYASIYPTLFTDSSKMSKDLRNHLRYSEDYFNIQAKIYQTYHMEDAQVFYNKEDSWQIATNFYQASKTPVNVNSAYLIMKLPERNEEFMIMVPFTPKGKTNMISWMSGMCDGEDYGKLIVYQMPKQKLIYGPLQIEQRIDQDTTISPQLTLLSQQGSQVLRGNMYTIPIEDSILYVEPVYVTAANETGGLPEVKKVIACYKDKIVMGNSLADVINTLFSTKLTSAASSNGEPATGTTTTDPTTQTMTQKEMIQQANQLFEKAQTAQKNGDWAAYGDYMKELQALLEKLNESIK